MTTIKSFQRAKIGVIGCGNMGSAMVRGLLESGFYPQNILAYDSDAETLRKLKAAHHIKLAKTNRQVASICDVVILAVKPQILPSVLDDVTHVTPKTTLVISIAAGVKIGTIQKAFKEKVPVVRAMPNMPALVGEGMSAYALGSYCTDKHRQISEAVLKSLGNVVEVREKQLDAVTAISGSGPAYFFLLAEKMIEAAYELGLKSSVAKQLVYQTAMGSAKILAQDKEDPDVLIKRVASKGGTTEAALKVFQREGFGKIIQDAIAAANKRSEELSEQ